jgi:hypothetical protein
VASLDVHTKGGLLEMPRVGVPMLFARVDGETGRVTLVRTAPIVRFETRNEARDDWDSGLRERPVSDQSEIYTQRAVDPVETERDAECRPAHAATAEADDADNDWEIDTRRMRRDEVWHDVEPDPDSNDVDDGDLDTATARVELQAAALTQARPPSYGSGPRDVYARRDIRDMQDARDVYQTAPPTRAVPAYSMPVPKAAPLPKATPLPRPPARPQTLPPPPANRRPLTPPPREQFHQTRPEMRPLPRTPVPTPPPRRSAFEDMQTPHRTYQEMPPPPRPLRPLNPVQPSAAWSDNRATVRRAR